MTTVHTHTLRASALSVCVCVCVCVCVYLTICVGCVWREVCGRLAGCSGSLCSKCVCVCVCVRACVRACVCVCTEIMLVCWRSLMENGSLTAETLMCRWTFRRL